MSDDAPNPLSIGGLDNELSALAEAHGAVADSLRRMFAAISNGGEALVGIERLRLENCVDRYRNCAAGVLMVFQECAYQAAERDGSDGCDGPSVAPADGRSLRALLEPIQNRETEQAEAAPADSAALAR